MKAVIFIGHGSKGSEGNEAFISFIDRLLAELDTPIKGYGFLENAEPSVFQAVDAAIGAGASEVTVVPVFLLPGVHANDDIPEEIALLKEQHTDIVFRYGDAIGAHPVMVEILTDRLKEKGHNSEDVVLVAHGSRVPDSAVLFEKLTAMLQERVGTKVRGAYFTAEPSYREVLANSSATALVLPYLLFSGGFLGKLRDLVEESRICAPVGFDQRLQQVLVEKKTKAEVL
ncbi:sirohydrochlorin chelatase [Pseudoneobacillus sp. C159]